MAKRIRSLKPEILEDEVVAALPHLDWRLFVSLIVMADDYGNLRGVSAYVRGLALWGSGDSERAVTEAISRLAGVGLIRQYTVRGQAYIHISGWDKHQKVDRPGKALCPDESEADPATCDIRDGLANHSRGALELFATDLDQGSGSGSGTGIVDREPALAGSHESIAKELWEAQEVARKRVNPNARGLSPTPDRLKRIVTLLERGRTGEELEAVLSEYEREAAETGSSEWLNGETNWRPANVDRTLGKLGARDPTEAEATAASEVLRRLSERTGVPWNSDRHAVRTVADRIRGGIAADDLWKIARYVASPLATGGLGWADDERMRPNLNPSTLFSKRSVDKHLTAARTWAGRN